MEERLRDIELKQAEILTLLKGMCNRMDERVKTSDEWRARVERTIYGYNGTPGLLVKIDRLEQSHERGRWLMRAVLGAVVTLVAGAMWALLTG